MRAAEFLQNLFNQAQKSQSAGTNINIGTIIINPTNEPKEVDSDETDVMVPPLQQKIELLKKNAGLDNVYDKQADDDEPLE
jgi:hypothetical protein